MTGAVDLGEAAARDDRARRPSVANVFTVPLAAGAQPVKLPLELNAARFETVVVVAPLWLDTCVNLPPTYVVPPICMIAFTRPFTCQVGIGRVAIVAPADGTTTSSATTAHSAASRPVPLPRSPLRYRGYEPRPVFATRNRRYPARGGCCQSYVPGGVHESSSLMPSGSKKKIAW